jgi:hypothetical protein
MTVFIEANDMMVELAFKKPRSSYGKFETTKVSGKTLMHAELKRLEHLGFIIISIFVYV